MLKQSRSIFLTRDTLCLSNCTALRPSLLQRSSSRNFHASRPAHNPYAQSLLLVHDALYSVHSLTGLPWVTAIPLTALLVRTTFITPISIYEHLVRRRRRRLAPLIGAWKGAFWAALGRERLEDGDKTLQQGVEMVQGNLRATRKRIYRDWGASGYIRALVISMAMQVGIGIHFMDCIRRMCGSQIGLVGLGDAGVALIPAEPSMATEGAFWFQDLLVADPFIALPIILSSSFLVGLEINKRLSSPFDATPSSKWQKRFQRAAPFVCVGSTFLWINMPAGLLVYLISASAIRTTENVLLRLVLSDKLPRSIREPKKE